MNGRPAYWHELCRRDRILVVLISGRRFRATVQRVTAYGLVVRTRHPWGIEYHPASAIRLLIRF